MLNRATVVGMAIALAVALLVVVLTYPSIGPQVSRAGVASPGISIEDLHRQVDSGKLPVHSAPMP